MRKRLTDFQLTAILTYTSLTDAQLAVHIGVSASTVHDARWSLRTHQWRCAVRYGTCRHCGHPMTIRRASTRHTYHDHCRAPARTAVMQRRDAERQVTHERIALIHAWSNATQVRTVNSAKRNGQRWTEDDDEIVLSWMDRPIEETCVELERSMYAVAGRRVVLRKRNRETS